MKKILFGTSALIAASFGSAGGASAAGLELDFSGSYTFGAGVYKSEFFPEKDLRGVFIGDGQLVATAKGTLDNGLTFGARMVFDVENGSSDVTVNDYTPIFDANGNVVGLTATPRTHRIPATNRYNESVGWVEGSFGRLEVGHEDGAHDRSVPGVAGTWFNAAAGSGILFDLDNFGAVDGGFSLDGRDTSDALKATYWTPSFSGFKAGVSYVPHNNSGINNGRLGNTERTTTNDAWEFGVRYTGSFNDVSVDVGGGYTLDPYGQATRDDSWAVAGNLGFRQFTVGATYEDRGRSATTDHGTGFGVGGAYTTGPWTFGAAYANGSSINLNSTSDTQGASIGVDYKLGQGVDISAGLEWIDRDSRGADIYGGGLVTRLSF